MIVFTFGSIQNAAFNAKPISFTETLSDDRTYITAELVIEGKVYGVDDTENADLLDWLAEVAAGQADSGGLQFYRNGLWEPTAAWLDFETYSLQRPEIQDLVIPDTSSGEVATEDAEFSLTLVAVRPVVAFPEIRHPLVLEQSITFTVDGSGGSPGSDFFDNVRDEWTELEISFTGTMKVSGTKTPRLPDFAPWSNFGVESTVEFDSITTDAVSGLAIQTCNIDQTVRLTNPQPVTLTGPDVNCANDPGDISSYITTHGFVGLNDTITVPSMTLILFSGGTESGSGTLTIANNTGAEGIGVGETVTFRVFGWASTTAALPMPSTGTDDTAAYTEAWAEPETTAYEDVTVGPGETSVEVDVTAILSELAGISGWDSSTPVGFLLKPVSASSTDLFWAPIASGTELTVE